MKIPQRRDPVIANGGTLAVTSREKAEMLAIHFESVFRPNPRSEESAAVESEVAAIAAAVDTLAVDGAIVPTFDRKDVGRILRRLAPRRAPGPDGISNAVLRELPKAAAAYVAVILNGCMLVSHFPSPWRRAKIVCLPKKVGGGS